MIKYGYFICWIGLSTLFQSIEGLCEYPSGLRGDWYSTSNGLLTFNNDSIDNLKTNVHSVPTSYTCELTQGSHYISKTEIQVLTNQKYTVLLCMSFTRITATKYLLTYNTDIDPSTNQRLVGILTSTTASFTYAQACNLTSSLPVGSQEILVRKDSIGYSGITCPSVLQSTFDVTLGSSTCNGTVLNGDVDNTQLQYNYSSCVDTSMSFSDDGTFSCVYYITSGSNDYLTVLNNDNSTDESKSYRFLCYVLRSSGDTVYATYHPQICQPSQTPTSVPSPGIQGNYTDRYYVTASTASSGGNTVVLVVVIVVVILVVCIIVITFVIVFIYVKKKRPTYVQDRPDSKTGENLLEQQGKSQECWRGKEEFTPQDKQQDENNDKKKRKKKRKKCNQQNAQIRSTEETAKSESRRVSWNEGMNEIMEEPRPEPEWQKRWEKFEDPLSRTKRSESTTPGANENRPDTARSITKVWIIPESEEQNDVISSWNKASSLLQKASTKHSAQHEFTNGSIK